MVVTLQAERYHLVGASSSLFFSSRRHVFAETSQTGRLELVISLDCAWLGKSQYQTSSKYCRHRVIMARLPLRGLTQFRKKGSRQRRLHSAAPVLNPETPQSNVHHGNRPLNRLAGP